MLYHGNPEGAYPWPEYLYSEQGLPLRCLRCWEDQERLVLSDSSWLCQKCADEICSQVAREGGFSMRMLPTKIGEPLIIHRAIRKT